MGIDWDNFDSIADKAIDEAKAKTDATLASEIESVLGLDSAKICELYPDTEDLSDCEELIAIVNSSRSDNEKVSAIMNGGERLVKVATIIIGKIT